MSELTPAPRPSPALAEEAISRFAEQLAPHLLRVLGRAAAPDSPWMNADGAAAYLCCPVSRVRKLTMTDDLPVHREGRRVLYHREDLDRFIREGGAICP